MMIIAQTSTKSQGSSLNLPGMSLKNPWEVKNENKSNLEGPIFTVGPGDHGKVGLSVAPTNTTARRSRYQTYQVQEIPFKKKKHKTWVADSRQTAWKQPSAPQAAAPPALPSAGVVEARSARSASCLEGRTKLWERRWPRSISLNGNSS